MHDWQDALVKTEEWPKKIPYLVSQRADGVRHPKEGCACEHLESPILTLPDILHQLRVRESSQNIALESIDCCYCAVRFIPS